MEPSEPGGQSGTRAVDTTALLGTPNFALTVRTDLAGRRELGPKPGKHLRSGRTVRHAEMAEHQELAAQLAIDASFCDPRSPWQRESNENANRLLRQYLAKGADLRRFSLRDLDDIARPINTRPRRVLDWATSAELCWPHVHAEYVP